MKFLTNLLGDALACFVVVAGFFFIVQHLVLAYYFFASDHLCFCKGDECVKTIRYRYAIKYDPDAEHWTGRSKDYRSHWRSHKNSGKL